MKVLILSATTGGGHMSASRAIKDYISENSKNSEVKIIDALEYISPFLNKTITTGYEQLVRKAPKILASMYENTNHEDKSLNNFVENFMAFVSKRLIPTIEDYKPDVVISIHPFNSEMISSLLKTGQIDVPHICVLTDYSPHLMWINECVDSYIIASEQMMDAMLNMGAPKEKIHAFGIPIKSVFFKDVDKKAILNGIGFDSDMPTVLVMAGSFGVTDILNIYEDLVNIDIPFQVIVITGKNPKLYKAFEKKLNDSNKHMSQRMQGVRNQLEKRGLLSKKPLTKKTKLIYFTGEVENYMKVSDVIITKPGGLTTSEALACNLPMIIFDAVPGQEEENADFLIKNNMARKLGKDNNIQDVLKELLTDSEKLEAMKSACTAFDKSDANENIVKEINRLISEKTYFLESK